LRQLGPRATFAFAPPSTTTTSGTQPCWPKEAATLDFLTDGRLEFGIGAGYARDEYDAAGLPFAPAVVRVERLEEAVQIIMDLWTGEPVNFTGRHYSISGLTNYPRPAQRPRPPILIAGGGRRILTLAAREADIVEIVAQASPEGNLRTAEDTLGLIDEKIGWMKSAAGPRFRVLELAILIWNVRVTDHPDDAAEDLGRENGLTPKQVLDSPYFLIGSIDSITESLVGLRERFGISHVSVFPRDLKVFAPIVARLADR
jgi:probable F420-dependent oxidoreductase